MVALLLDGGLGSTLEPHTRRWPVDDPRHKLWASGLLISEPETVLGAHRAFFAAGANAVETCTYQATLPGLREHLKLDPSAAEAVIASAVRLAHEAREERGAELAKKADNPLPPLAVYRSCGPFAAYRADGSEYTAAYPPGLTERDLKDFHRSRLSLFSDPVKCPPFAHGDCVILETLPSAREIADVYELLAEFPDLRGRTILAATLRTPDVLPSGDPCADTLLALLARDAADRRLAAVGLNCVAPAACLETFERFVARGRASRDLDVRNWGLLACPNSGEEFDVGSKTYDAATRVATPSLAQTARALVDLGVSLIGGCCRVYPRDIAGLGRALRIGTALDGLPSAEV